MSFSLTFVFGQNKSEILKHKKINFKSINWENLLLWSLLIVSFILAIVAISKSGKQGPAGRDGRDGISLVPFLLLLQ